MFFTHYFILLMCQNCSSLLISLHLQRSFTLVTEQTSGLGADLCILRVFVFMQISLVGNSGSHSQGKKARETAIPINSHCHLVSQNSGSDFLNSCWVTEFVFGVPLHLSAAAGSRTHGSLDWVCFATHS